MKTIHSVSDFKSYDSKTMLERFLMDKQVQPDQIICTYSQYDRMIVGIAKQVSKHLN